MYIVNFILIVISLIILILGYNTLGFKFQPNFFYHYEPNIYVYNGIVTDIYKQLTNVLPKTSQVNYLNQADVALITDRQLSQIDKTKFTILANIHHPTLLLIAPDHSQLVDLDDLIYYRCKNSSNKISIIADSNSEYNTLHDILNFYPKSLRDRCSILLKKNWDGVDYLVYAKYVLPNLQDDTVYKLTQQQPVHLLTMMRINGGNYFVVKKEQPFYIKNKWYNKVLFDISGSLKYYPLLSRIGNQQYSIYNPSIKTNYVLVVKKSLTDRIAKKLLSQILKLHTERKLSGLTISDISRNTSPLDYHLTAHALYNELHLVVDNNKASIYDLNKLID